MCSTASDHPHGGRPELPAGVWHDLEPPQVIGLVPVDSVRLTLLMDNLTDGLLPDGGPATRPVFGAGATREVTTFEGGLGPDPLVAEHGYSVLVTVERAGVSHTLLFDTGTSPGGVVGNMRRLGIDPSVIEAVVCSHGHFDHTTGLAGLLDVLGPRNLPVLLHPDFWTRRRIVVPGRDPVDLPSTSRTALTGAGFEIVEDPAPSFVLDGSVLVTGEVARTTGYEVGLPGQQAWRRGRWEADPMVLDDQALVIDVAGRGLVVITGCGHAGIVNICRWASRLTGDRPVHAVIGGFHLGGPLFEPLLPRVLDDLVGIAPAVVVPGHCTGWRAQHGLAAGMPDSYVAGAVGTTITLRAAADPGLQAA